MFRSICSSVLCGREELSFRGRRAMEAAKTGQGHDNQLPRRLITNDMDMRSPDTYINLLYLVPSRSD